LAQDPQDLVRQGIDAARNGDKLMARRLLQQALSLDPDNEIGWMWMASVVDTVEERRRCLERVLRINPNNARAKEAITRLGGTIPPRPTATTPDAQRGGTPNPRVARPVDRTQSRQGLNAYLIAAGVVAVLVVVVIAVGLLSNNVVNVPNPIAQPTSAFDATFAAAAAAAAQAITLTPTHTLPPPTPTVFGVIVTLDEERRATQLPPTFTHTPSPPPTTTPTLTPTPFPMTVYELVYADFQDGETQASLFANNGTGETEAQLGDQGYLDIAIDPQGGRFAFVRETTITAEDGTQRTAQNLFVAPLVDPDSAVAVTDFTAPLLRHPSFSPDGSEIVFAANPQDDLELYVVSIDENGVATSPIRQITDNIVPDDYPDWSPDGSLIAFASQLEGVGFFEVYTIEPDGANLTRITDASGSNYAPRWSPDGTRMLFVTDRGGQNDIYIMEANGNTQRLLTFGDGAAQSYLPAWSPDGLWIAFASDRSIPEQADKFNWYLMDVRGENVRPLRISQRDPQSIRFLPTLNVR
jgi:hypothetical protein